MSEKRESSYRTCLRSIGLSLLQILILIPPLFAQVPKGYSSYKNAEHNLQWAIPRTFAPIPIPPNEREILARYVRGTSRKQREKGLVVTGRPQIWVVSLGGFQPKGVGAETENPDPSKFHLPRASAVADTAPMP